VNFDSAGPSSNIVNFSNNILGVVNTGTYDIDWFVNVASQFVIYVNGAARSSTLFGTVGDQNRGRTILNLNASDQIQLVNLTGSPVVLPTGVGGTTPNTVNATLIIKQIA
jgi:hypothetical protein